MERRLQQEIDKAGFGSVTVYKLFQHAQQYSGYSGWGSALDVWCSLGAHLAEGVDVEQRLQQGVHVAGGPLVLEPHAARLRLAVVVGAVCLVHLRRRQSHGFLCHTRFNQFQIPPPGFFGFFFFPVCFFPLFFQGYDA